ncbi:MAG TPA: type I phosphomannose isomerase catalytic subunit [Terriglobia bacterium]|nr:type I phosphomannose isomerase catalytic subunit [Terriglobia bacterium]
MPKFDTPLLLAPDFKEKIWGRENLEPLYPAPEMDAGNGASNSTIPGVESGDAEHAQATIPQIGEAWLTGEQATFLSGPVAGLTLGEVMKSWPAELCGRQREGAAFPLLAKFLFTSDWLSMQVHPDDDYAARHEKSRGKTEAWYFINCQRDAEIALALPAETTRAALEAACREARSLEFANRFRPKSAEVVYVPAGTLHALGPDLVLFEVSETSDVTYRLDDYGRLDAAGRPRQLHLERGLETTELLAPAHRDLPKLEFQEPFGKRRYAVACRYFAVEELGLREPAKFAASKDRVECLAVISGAGRVEIEAGWLAFRPGQTWVVPAGSSPYRLVPEKPSRLLRFYVPDLERDFRQPLAHRGVPPEVIGKVVFED